MSFVYHSGITKQHPNAFVIAVGGILFEIDEFKEGAEFRQRMDRGTITKITDDSFVANFEDGFSIKYPLPYEIYKSNGHLEMSDEFMYLYGFWKRQKTKRKTEQLTLY